MKIINKRENYEYDTDYNSKETLKLVKLISIFLQTKENTNTQDLFNLIKYFYAFEIETKDYLDYLNQTEGANFDKTVEIPTNSIVMDICSEGHGRDFSWWSQNYQIMIKSCN